MSTAPYVIIAEEGNGFVVMHHNRRWCRCSTYDLALTEVENLKLSAELMWSHWR